MWLEYGSRRRTSNIELFQALLQCDRIQTPVCCDLGHLLDHIPALQDRVLSTVINFLKEKFESTRSESHENVIMMCIPIVFLRQGKWGRDVARKVLYILKSKTHRD